MKRLKGKLLSTIMVLAMTLQCVPAVAFAETTDVVDADVVVIETELETELERPERPAPAGEAPAEAPEGERPERPEEDAVASVQEEIVTVAETTCGCGETHEIDGEWTAISGNYSNSDDGLITSGNYYLSGDTTLQIYNITVPDGETLNLCLNGYTLSGCGSATSPVIRVSSGGTLNLYGSSADDFAGSWEDSAYVISNVGSGVITGGKITSDTTYYGAGVYVASGATFNMYGGNIAGNSNEKTNGGGVGVLGEFNMYGGSIAGNTSAEGAGVFINAGTFNMDGESSIVDNKATSGGGGVFVYGSSTDASETATFTMKDGTISDNTAADHSGGVFVYRNATFTMKDGEISENEVTSDDGVGGGVAMYSTSHTNGNATFVMEDGSIESNKATSGAGVYVEGRSTSTEAKFQMDGGSIEKNKATGNGGGVYAIANSSDVAGNTTVTMNDGTISGNDATNGGGVYVYSSNSDATATFDMNGGTIGGTEGNTASGDGGGVYVWQRYGTVEATIDNSAITGNTAADYGADVLIQGGTTTTTDSSTFGTPIYVWDGEVTLTLENALSYGTVDMKDYFDFDAYIIDSYIVEYSVTSEATGAFSDSIFTPATSGGDFVLSATERETLGSTEYGTANLVFSMDKKASTSSSYYIKATATGNGTVAPEDEDVSADSMYKVSKGSDVTFEFDADSGYEVTDVIVNGSSVGACDEYEFENIIDKMQTLEVVFEKSSSSSSSDDDEDDEDADDEDADDDDADESEVPFADVDTDDDNYDGIAYVYENGIMAGISSEVFGGELSITRGMIAAILFRVDGSEAVDAEMLFDDVSADQYYVEAVKWGKVAGVMAGISETEFAPNTAITIEQFAAFLYRYATYLGMDMTVSGDVDLSGYAMSDYAYTAIAWVLENDIIEADDLEPMAEAMRGDVATALMNFMEMM